MPLAFIGTVISFVTSNLKMFAILAALGAIGFAALKVYDAGKAEVEVKYLRQELSNKNEAIRMLSEAKRLADVIVEQRDNELDELERKYQELMMDDLGPTKDDQADESLKELFRRLKGTP